MPAAAVIPALGAEALGAPATINGSSFPLPIWAPWAGHVVFWGGVKRTHEKEGGRPAGNLYGQSKSHAQEDLGMGPNVLGTLRAITKFSNSLTGRRMRTAALAATFPCLRVLVEVLENAFVSATWEEIVKLLLWKIQ